MVAASPHPPKIKPNKGKWLTVQQKYEVILQHQRHPSVSCSKLAEWATREFALQDPPSR
ncbi:hypothetical protein PR003_g12924 [Phytophthora rubi]|uniref:ARS-binding protein 1 N-terminal domain-containing protein n=1 Tax=Phytophthora rubi TaxID=129364 RepID=A0A6A4FIX5_9STRA|nr:hypothetical protein PR003_g12924 [Phytophthora rubi]